MVFVPQPVLLDNFSQRSFPWLKDWNRMYYPTLTITTSLAYGICASAATASCVCLYIIDFFKKTEHQAVQNTDK